MEDANCHPAGIVPSDEVVSIDSAELCLFSRILSRISLRRFMRPVMPVLSSSWISDAPDSLALTISPRPTPSRYPTSAMPTTSAPISPSDAPAGMTSSAGGGGPISPTEKIA